MGDLSLSRLEEAVIAEIIRQHPESRGALQQQLSTAKVIRRENTGVGFFTYLSVDTACPTLPEGETVIGNVWADIDKFEAPMTFLIFVVDGYIDVLEGATCGDSTVDIDLALLEFTIDVT